MTDWWFYPPTESDWIEADELEVTISNESKMWKRLFASLTKPTQEIVVSLREYNRLLGILSETEPFKSGLLPPLTHKYGGCGGWLRTGVPQIATDFPAHDIPHLLGSGLVCAIKLMHKPP